MCYDWEMSEHKIRQKVEQQRLEPNRLEFAQFKVDKKVEREWLEMELTILMKIVDLPKI